MVTWAQILKALMVYLKQCLSTFMHLKCLKCIVTAYLGLPEVTVDVTSLGTNVYCLAEMGILVSKLFGYSGSFTVEDFSRITASWNVAIVVCEEKKDVNALENTLH